MMDAPLAFRGPDVSMPGRLSWRDSDWAGYPSTRTSTLSSVEAPPSSAAASTTEVSSQGVSVAATWIEPLVKRLNHLLQLQDGWGGPGTLRVDRDVVSKTIVTLIRIGSERTRPPSISPGQDGSLQLAWYAREFELEIDIPRSGDPAVSLYDHNSEEELELTLASPELYAAIGRLAAD
jgi:hypothetical protein